ncbi:MAG: GTP 3',8-cyclase MoaA [Planctomycetota bacterium]|nr:GTP 3',8-cyclase MoaA [Planctomycetota bacterium]
MLIDSFGRVHRNLRISVTDRCNIRCFYCMPNEAVTFQPRSELLTFEEIVRFVRVAAPLGVNRLRLTGGEPLVRAELPKLVAALAQVPGIEDLAMTTNGLLLADQAPALKAAGLRRLNISLDTLSEATFRHITRRGGLARVLDGIALAQRLGFERIRLNAVVIRGVTENDIVPLAGFAREHDVELRFLEFMPLDADRQWQDQHVVSGDEICARLQETFGPLVPADRPDPSQPAMDFRFADGRGRIGLISPVTQPFCHDCNRLRITAEGQVRNCLFSTVEWDARQLLRNGGSDEQLAELVQTCVSAKKVGHGIDSPVFVRPERAMYQIGG